MSDHPHLDTLDAIAAAWTVAADEGTKALLLAAWRSAKEAAVENGYNLGSAAETTALSELQRSIAGWAKKGHDIVPNDDGVKP